MNTANSEETTGGVARGSVGDRPVVPTSAGAVRGIWREGSAAFLGIPFAEPPVGALRFAAPVPHRPWIGVRDTARYGPTPQRAREETTIIPEPSVPGESTLNVNVFSPRPGDTGAGLPVLVFIHGGGFIAGSPASPWYDGAAFNRDDVVLITVSYRLGFQGFGWIEDAPQNRAILDWILALEWVRDNARSFGGDPARITVAGQSAGAAAVLALLACPRADGLFHRALSLSAAVAEVSIDQAEQIGRRFAALADLPPTAAALSTLGEKRILDIETRIGALSGSEEDADDPLTTLGVMLSGGGLSWCPVIDGDLLPRGVLDGCTRASALAKPLLMGTTDQEFSGAFAPLTQALADIDAAAALRKAGVPSPLAESFRDAHAGEPTTVVLGQFLTDSMFRRPTRAVGERRAAANAPTWLYRFSWRSPTTGMAIHCLDLPFFFDRLDAERVGIVAGANPPQTLVADVHRAAVTFVRDADPGWPRYTTPRRQVRIFDVPSTVVDDGYHDTEIRFG